MSYEMKFIGRLSFTARAPIHIGGVREGNFLYILRLSDGRLIIPASSWKGALRALAERLATSMPLSV
ncbi:MAG: RAMP superfamily CRISPR-associated protein, partial [Infirmifilum sp.]